jgi:uncharacterized protein YneF (UPF0154 family)
VNSKSEIEPMPLGFSFMPKGWRRFWPGVDLSAATVRRKTRRAQARRLEQTRYKLLVSPNPAGTIGQTDDWSREHSEVGSMSDHVSRRQLKRIMVGAISLLILTCMAMFAAARYFVAWRAMVKTLRSMPDLRRWALAEIRQQPGCHKVQDIAINRVTDERA